VSQILLHTYTHKRTYARTTTEWFSQLTMAVGAIMWLPGGKRISWTVIPPCINVTHARIFVHIAYQLTLFQSPNTTVYSQSHYDFTHPRYVWRHYVTTMLMRVSQYTNYLHCNGDRKHASAWWRHNNDETRSVNENKREMWLAAGTRETEWKCSIAYKMIWGRKVAYLRTLSIDHNVGVEKWV